MNRSISLHRVVVVALLVLAHAGCGRPADESGEAARPEPLSPERVLAEVNGRPIRASQLEELQQAERLLLDGGAPPDSASALDLAIRGELVFQAAEAAGLSADESEIASQWIVVRSQFSSDEEFAAHLQEAGLTEEELRERIRRRLLMRAYVRTITASLEIDESELRRLYEEQKQQFVSEEQVRAAQILIRCRPDDDPETREAARARIEQVHRRAMAGEDFAELARQFSESPLAERGGDLGFFPRGRMLPEFESVVFATPTGAITPVFETPHGWNVVRVTERREAKLRPYEEVRTGLLMVLARERKNRALREHVDELRRAATIRIL